MILATIGTSVPFDRLLDALGRVRTDERLVVQRGRSDWSAAGVQCVDFWPYPVLVEHVRQARVVVTHAGVGSILVCLQNGKRPVVAPRLRRFGEAVDDHQVELGRRLHETGVVTLVEDLELLPKALEAAAPDAESAFAERTALAAELRSYLAGRVRSAAAARGA
jgi:UDP-N-acetylglucosamine transferase subunit ALG13